MCLWPNWSNAPGPNLENPPMTSLIGAAKSEKDARGDPGEGGLA